MRLLRRDTTRRKPTRGFTLIETLLAVTIMATIIGSILAILRTSGRAFQVTSTSTRLDSHVLEVLDRIADRLRASKLSTVTPAQAPPLSSPSIDFQATTGFSGGVPVWGNTERIILVNGQVQWIQNLGLASQKTSILARNVPTYLQGEVANGNDDNHNGLIDERGLCFSVTGTSVTVRLSLQSRTSSGTTITHTAQERIFFRNR